MRVLLIPLLLLALAGCMNDPLPEPPMRDGEAIVAMGGDVGDRYEPDVFQVEQGTVVRFEHRGGDSIHNVRSDDGAWEHRQPDLEDFVLDTARLPAGDYPFFCDAHLNVGMDGIMRVV